MTRTVVIGCGYWGKNLVRNFAQIGALAAVCDANQDHALQIAQQYGVPTLSFEQVLNSEIESVVIATPAAQHYLLARAALIAGKHVFVEKPLSLNIDEAQELCNLAQQLERILMVGHLLQYHPAVIKLKTLVGKRELGKLQYIYSNRLNLGKFRHEENILWSFAPHDISMILALTAEMPETIYATGSCHLNIGVHDVTTTYLTFKSGLEAYIFVSWLHPFKEQKLVVVGDHGMAVFDDSLPWSEKLRLYPHKVKWINGLPQPEKAEALKVELEPCEPLRLECEHFIASIQNNQQPRTDGAEGLAVLKVLDAAQKSLQTKTKIVLTPSTKAYFVHETAIVDPGCEIGNGTKIWHFSHILKGSIIGEACVIGQSVMIGPDVVVGNRAKIQNNVSLYKGVTLEDGVFCGPSCVFTNVHNPRAEIERKDEFRLTLVRRGATIGANATIICGNTLGAYCLIGAGAVVTKDVKPYAVMVGNPAKQIGWACQCGEILDKNLVCQREQRRYQVNKHGDLEAVTTSEVSAVY